MRKPVKGRMSSEGMGGRVLHGDGRGTPKIPSEDTVLVAHSVVPRLYPPESLK